MSLDVSALIGLSRKALWEEFEYAPHPGQQLYHASKARFRVAACGRRFGKSEMSMMDGAVDLFVPKARWWVVAESYFTGEEEFNYIEEAILKLVRKYKFKLNKHLHNAKQGDLIIEMPFGSSVSVRSAGHPKSLVGKGLKRVTLAEAAKLDPAIFDKAIRPALADFRGRADFTSTPEGDNWFKTKHDMGQLVRDGNPNAKHRLECGAAWEESYESWNLPSWLNTYIYPGGFNDPEIQAQMGTPDGTPIFWQEIGAKFDVMVGQVYPDFKDAVNVLDHQYRPEWHNYNFFDFGFSPHSWVCLDVQVGPCRWGSPECEGDWYIWREYEETGKTVLRNIDELKARGDPGGFRIECGFGDASSPGDIEELNRYWCPVVAMPEAKQDFGGAVHEVSKRIRGKDGNPHLFVSPRCPRTIHTLKNYKWPEKNIESNKPKGQDDDIPDALRYGAMHFKLMGIGIDLDKFFEAAPPVDDTPMTRKGMPIHDSFFDVGLDPVFTMDRGPF